MIKEETVTVCVNTIITRNEKSGKKGIDNCLKYPTPGKKLFGVGKSWEIGFFYVLKTYLLYSFLKKTQ